MNAQSAKGLVLENQGRMSITVLTAEGEFRRIPWRGMPPAVGDYVDVPAGVPAGAAPGSPQGLPLFRRLLPPLSLAAVLILGFFLGRLAFAPPVAAAEYVAMDINPSLELDLSQRGTVLATTSFNADAGRVLGGLHLAGTPWEGAVAAIIARSQTLGFLKTSGDNLVTVTTVPAGTQKVMPVAPSQVQGYVAAQLRQRRLFGSVLAGQGTSTQRRQALAQHLSLNKYLLYEKAQQNHLDLSVNTVQKMPIKELLRQTGLNLQEVYPSHRLEEVGRGTGTGTRTGTDKHEQVTGHHGTVKGPSGWQKLLERLRERLQINHGDKLPPDQGQGNREGSANSGSVAGSTGAGTGPTPSPSDSEQKAARILARLRQLQQKCLQGGAEACTRLASLRARFNLGGGKSGNAVLPEGILPEGQGNGGD